MPDDEQATFVELLNELLESANSILPVLPPIMIGLTNPIDANSIVIQTSDGQLIIKGNGEVQLPDGATASEAAKAFWKAVQIAGSQKETELLQRIEAAETTITMLQAAIEERNFAISRLFNELEKLKCNGPRKELPNRFTDIVEEDDADTEKDKAYKSKK